MKEGLVYLASPYSHKNERRRHERFIAACKAAAKLMSAGWRVFCPIAHSHSIGLVLGKPTDHEFWMRQDMAVLKHAAYLTVLRLDGWERSIGVAAEIDFAMTNAIPIDFIDP